MEQQAIGLAPQTNVQRVCRDRAAVVEADGTLLCPAERGRSRDRARGNRRQASRETSQGERAGVGGAQQRFAVGKRRRKNGIDSRRGVVVRLQLKPRALGTPEFCAMRCRALTGHGVERMRRTSILLHLRFGETPETCTPKRGRRKSNRKTTETPELGPASHMRLPQLDVSSPSEFETGQSKARICRDALPPGPHPLAY